MRKLLAFLFLASSAFAQQQVQPVAGVLTLNLVPGTSSFKVILSANVTSVVIQNPTPGTIISVIFTENATGGFTVAFGGNIANPCTVTTTANATTTCQFQYDATSNTWNGIGGGGGGSGTITAGFLGPTYVFASAYGVSGLARWYNDATFNTATTTCGGATVPAGTCVTTPAGERAFLCPSSTYPCSTAGTGSDVGYIEWGSNAQFGGNVQTNILTDVPRGTITQVITAHAVQVSVAATSNCTPTNNDGCTFNLGPPNEDTPFQNALNAAYNACGVLVLTGWTVLEAQHNNTTSACPVGASSNDPGSGMGVIGIGGHESGVMISPNAPANIIPLFQRPTIQADMVFKDFGVMAPETIPAVSGNGIFVNFNSQVSGLWLVDWWASAAGTVNWTALACSGVANAITNCDNNIVMNSGFTGMNCTSTGPAANCTRNWVQGEIVGMSVNGTGPVNLAQNVVSLQTNNALATTSGTTLFSTDDLFSKTGANSLVSVGIVGSTATFTDVTANNLGAAANAISFFCDAASTCKIGGQKSSIVSSGATSVDISNAGTLTLQNASLTGGTTTVSNSGTVTFLPGNTLGAIINTGTLQGQPGQGVLYGSCTGTATASQTLTLFQLGEVSATTCTVTGAGTIGQVMSKAGTAYALYVTAGTGGVAAGSGVFTVFLNHNGTNTGQTITCTVGTGTTCTDGAHSFAYVAGDIITVQFTTQAVETLANLRALVVTQ